MPGPKSRTWLLTQLSVPKHDCDHLSANLVGGTQSDSHNLRKQRVTVLEFDTEECGFSLHVATRLGQVAFPSGASVSLCALQR